MLHCLKCKGGRNPEKVVLTHHLLFYIPFTQISFKIENIILIMITLFEFLDTSYIIIKSWLVINSVAILTIYVSKFIFIVINEI